MPKPTAPIVEQSELIRADELMHGDMFKELADSRKEQAGRVQELLGQCKTEPGNIHMKTSRGTWCIAKGQMLVLK